MRIPNLSALLVFFAVAVCVCACSGKKGPTISEPSQVKLVEKARKSLDELYSISPKAKELRSHAAGILVFPGVIKAGLIVGGSGGNGVLFSPGGHVLGYYNLAAVSYGLQFGAESFSEAMFLVTPESLTYLDHSSGWSIGAGPNVVVVDAGMGKDLSSTTLRSDVYAFIYGQKGLMAAIGLNGQKITKLRPSGKSF